VLAAVTGIYFYLHPADWRFWSRAATEARKTRIAEEVRAWWGRIVVESPEVPSPPSGVASDTPMTLAPAPSLVPVAPVSAPEPEVTANPSAPSPNAADGAESTEAPAPDPALPSPAPAAGAAQAPVGAQLAIEFEHHLRHGRLRVWVDEMRVVDEDFDGRVTRKILSLELRKGLVQQRLTLPPGRHDVRVEVRWGDTVKSARISGRFASGSSRKLDVSVSRLGGRLSLDWK
jgi:hypothetical protein